jgi:hypothetical protein
MKTASAAVVVATIVTMTAIDGQWAAAAAVVAVCTAGAFAGSVSTK